MSKKLTYLPDVVSGIELIETGYAPRNVALLFGRRDTRIRYGNWRSKPLFIPDLELVGRIDFNTGEMEFLQYSSIQQIRADEPTLTKIRELIEEKEQDNASMGFGS